MPMESEVPTTESKVFVIMKGTKDSIRFIECEIILLPSHGRILSFADKALTVYLCILTRKTVSNIFLCGDKRTKDC